VTQPQDLRAAHLEDRLREYLGRHHGAIMRRSLANADDLRPLRTRLIGEILAEFLKVLAHDPADRAGLDRLVFAFAARPWAGIDPMRLLGAACAVTGVAFVGEQDGNAELAAYVDLRFGALARAFERALLVRSIAAPTVDLPGDEIVEALLRSLEARDGATCAHSRAVGAWSVRLARELGLRGADLAVVHAGGLLHDIGKIATPREILLKAGPLDSDEWEKMRAHTRVGAEIVMRLPSVRACVGAVRSHHERYDGHGYPDRLVGTAIPSPARIVAVADAFHAMTSTRPYQAAMPAAAALRTLIAGRRRQWDPDVVDAFAAIIRPAAVDRGFDREEIA